MCHGDAVQAFPAPAPAAAFSKAVAGFQWGAETATERVAILPDIYGCNPFYRGLATRYAEMNAQVYLIDPFDGLGELEAPTRELAFARRHKVHDRAFIDSFEKFCVEERITCVIGFCLGGLYVFELARRQVAPRLIGLYGFPQGLPNQDPLDPPFLYLADVKKPFTMLMGRDDASVGGENIARLEQIAPVAPAMSLKMYDGVGHNFLPLLDSSDAHLRGVARDALHHLDQTVFP